MEAFFFLLLAVVSIFSGLMVILQKSPVASVLFLVLTLVCVAALFVMLSAPFIAAIQVIIYAGAIMVLFLFVLMLLNLQRFTEGAWSRFQITGVVVAAVLAVVTALLLRAVPLPADSGFLRETPGLGSVEAVGLSLFTEYLLPFEIASFLLLAGIIGAVILSRRRP
ncbi:MAG: NADH-quinone oxidoreductase subunit J [Candidatus Zixiibacteriota bacterium]|nr:MAG: NADH-quinone oxidoreductase subunit J [candidate division Zixibacteria bacterium]